MGNHSLRVAICKEGFSEVLDFLRVVTSIVWLPLADMAILSVKLMKFSFLEILVICWHGVRHCSLSVSMTPYSAHDMLHCINQIAPFYTKPFGGNNHPNCGKLYTYLYHLKNFNLVMYKFMDETCTPSLSKNDSDSQMSVCICFFRIHCC